MRHKPGIMLNVISIFEAFEFVVSITAFDYVTFAWTLCSLPHFTLVVDNAPCYPPKLHYGEFPASRQRLNIIVQNSEFRNSAGLKDHLVTLHFHKKL
jgi:hypothetical protein